MSLLNSASAWSNDDTSKKRTPSIRKTIKRSPNIQGIGQPDSYLSQEEDYHDISNVPNTIEDTVAGQESRNGRVNDLLNKITSDNAGNKLANFNPIVNPSLTRGTDSLERIQDDKILSPDEFGMDLGLPNMPPGANQMSSHRTNNSLPYL